jgi:hypothetical protein
LSGVFYHLYFGNFFTSVSLLEKLLQRNIYACDISHKIWETKQAIPTHPSQRKEKDGSTSTLIVPEYTEAYNTFMAGVDRTDQLTPWYQRKLIHISITYVFIKWIIHQVHFPFLLECCISNCITLSKKSSDTPFTGSTSFSS